MFKCIFIDRKGFEKTLYMENPPWIFHIPIPISTSYWDKSESDLLTTIDNTVKFRRTKINMKLFEAYYEEVGDD